MVRLLWQWIKHRHDHAHALQWHSLRGPRASRISTRVSRGRCICSSCSPGGIIEFLALKWGPPTPNGCGRGQQYQEARAWRTGRARLLANYLAVQAGAELQRDARRRLLPLPEAVAVRRVRRFSKNCGHAYCGRSAGLFPRGRSPSTSCPTANAVLLVPGVHQEVATGTRPPV